MRIGSGNLKMNQSGDERDCFYPQNTDEAGTSGEKCSDRQLRMKWWNVGALQEMPQAKGHRVDSSFPAIETSGVG